MLLFPEMMKGAVWRYWLLTLVPLLVGVVGYREGIYVAMALTAVQFVHFALRTRSLSSFPVQVRLGFLALLVLGLWPPLFWIHWIQVAGTLAMLLFGYCPLARTMSLLPWNLNTPLSWQELKRVVFTPPVAGSILQRSEVRS